MIVLVRLVGTLLASLLLMKPLPPPLITSEELKTYLTTSLPPRRKRDEKNPFKSDKFTSEEKTNLQKRILNEQAVKLGLPVRY